MIQLADRMESVHSDIRGELFHEALRMQANGIQVLKLNTGNPAAFGFPLPESVRTALEGNTHKAVPYCDFQGMIEAREAIARYETSKGIEGLHIDDVFIGNGVSEVVNFALMPLLNPGDEVLIPTPNYSLWSNTIILCGAKPVYYRCDEASDWNPDVEDLRSKITSKTRALVIINPNNPTGALYSTDILNQMLDVAREHDLVVFSDEIYDRLVLDDLVHVSTASLAPDLTVVTMNGLSKSHSLCGYRCGWMAISGPRASTEAYRKGIIQLTSMRLCSNALAQLVIPAALEDMETPSSMVRPGGRFAFSITGTSTSDEHEDYSNVIGMDFTGAETRYATVLIPSYIDLETVSVKEVISGDYTPDHPEASITKGEDGKWKVTFKNKYTDTGYKTGAINNYKYNNENGTYTTPEGPGDGQSQEGDGPGDGSGN